MNCVFRLSFLSSTGSMDYEIHVYIWESVKCIIHFVNQIIVSVIQATRALWIGKVHIKLEIRSRNHMPISSPIGITCKMGVTKS